MRNQDKAVGIWIRVSTEDQAKGESPENHLKRAEAYAQAREWHVADVYDLSGVSGKSVMDHPECQRMLGDIKCGRISGLIFSKLARLARNTKELLDFSEYFEQYGADLISLHESIDTGSPAGRLFFTVIAALAQFEREEIAERVKASVPIRAKMGKNIGGQASFGYQWVDGALVPHPTEAPIRKLMYDLFLEHKRKKTVARLLNEQGYRTRKGGAFSDTTIDRLLRDPTAKGLHRANYTRSQGVGKAAELKDESEWVYREVEAIVPEDTWQRCNAILDEMAAGRKPTKKRKHLLGGYVFCNCGHKMHARSSPPIYRCSKSGCTNKIPIEDIDGIYHSQLKAFVFSDVELEQHLQAANEVLTSKKQQLKVLVDEQRKLEKQADQLYDLYIDGQIDSKGFGKRNKPLEERLAQIEEELPNLEAQIDIMKNSKASREVVLNDTRDLYSRWSCIEEDEKRSIVEAITKQIVVDDQSVEIKLLYVPSTKNADHRATNSHGFIAATN
ncbi:MAG: recombinase family protein [Methyloligellaceae bacterium]